MASAAAQACAACEALAVCQPAAHLLHRLSALRGCDELTHQRHAKLGMGACFCTAVQVARTLRGGGGKEALKSFVCTCLVVHLVGGSW